MIPSIFPPSPNSYDCWGVAGRWKESRNKDEWWGCQREYRPSTFSYSFHNNNSSNSNNYNYNKNSFFPSFNNSPLMSPPPHPPLKGEEGGSVHINSKRVGGRQPNRNNNNPPPPPTPEGETWGKNKIINSRESRKNLTKRENGKKVLIIG